MLQHLKERRQDEKGFTLIELMVVVLIMGILMAIAIPTFLSTRGSANDASAKSNATNAFTNEKSYYAANQIFEAANASEAGATLDSSLPWGNPTSATNVVDATVTSTSCSSSAGCAVLVSASSTSGNCFYIYDDETGSSSIIAYSAVKGTTSAPCTASSGLTLPTAAPAGNTNSGVAASVSAMTWAAAW